MNIKSNIKAGLAALTVLTAPITGAAKKTANAVVNDSVKIEQTFAKEGNKYVSITRKTNKNTGAFLGECRIASTEKPAGFKLPGEPKEQEGVIRVGVDFNSHEILSQRANEPRIKAQFDGRSGKIYVRPEVAVGTETYNAVLPIGVQLNAGKGAFVEIGSDLAGVRGFHNGKKVFFQSSVDKVMSGKDCKATPYRGEFFQNLHVGGRYKNDVVNASIRGEAGRLAFIDGGFVKEASGYKASQIEASGIPVIKEKSGYVGARANVEVTPFKNKNIAINAESAVSTNKKPEALVGVNYKF